jgi:hypothetical protein
MATNHSSKRPATTLRCGNIKATIWQNVSENGPFFATTFSRPFKDLYAEPDVAQLVEAGRLRES